MEMIEMFGVKHDGQGKYEETLEDVLLTKVD